MTVRYAHVRHVDSCGVIQPNGGITIAYTVHVYKDSGFDIIAAWAQCCFSGVSRWKWAIYNNVKKLTYITLDWYTEEELWTILEPEDVIIGRIAESLIREAPDSFCRKTGREEALRRLQDKTDDSRVVVISGAHPLSITVAENLLCTLYDGPVKVVHDYARYKDIDGQLKIGKRKHLMSTFELEIIH